MLPKGHRMSASTFEATFWNLRLSISIKSRNLPVFKSSPGDSQARCCPVSSLVSKLDPALLSRDQEIGKRFEADELCHNTGTLEGLSGLLDRTSQLASGKIVIPDNAGEGGVTRIWIGHGDKDGVTDYNASKRLFDALQIKDKEFKTYPEHFHRCKYLPRLAVQDAYFSSTRRTKPGQGGFCRRCCKLDFGSFNRAG